MWVLDLFFYLIVIFLQEKQLRIIIFCIFANVNRVIR